MGHYALSDELTFGGNVTLQSGRPKNCFGVYGGTTDTVSQLYGDASFWCGGQVNARGTLGRLPWMSQLDLQAGYKPASIKGLSLTLDLLNVFNKRTVRGIVETEGSGMNDPLSTYGQPITGSLQSARRVRLLAAYEF